MLVPVQFPDDFVTPGFVEVQKVDGVPRLQRRSFPVDRIHVPVDFLTVIEVRVSEQGEPVLADGIGFAENEAYLLREQFLQERDAPGYLVGVKEKLPARRAVDGRARSSEVVSGLVGDQVNALAYLLTGTSAHFVPAHLGEPSPGFVPAGGHEFPYLTRRSGVRRRLASPLTF